MTVSQEPVPSELNVKDVLTEFLAQLILPKRKHDGSKVQTAMIEGWKRLYPWIIYNDIENKLHCDVCVKAKMPVLMGQQGSSNIQMSTTDRHAASSEHKEAERKLSVLGNVFNSQ